MLEQDFPRDPLHPGPVPTWPSFDYRVQYFDGIFAGFDQMIIQFRLDIEPGTVYLDE
jgi:hypothetical protein